MGDTTDTSDRAGDQRQPEHSAPTAEVVADLPADDFSALAWQANVYSHDPHYGPEPAAASEHSDLSVYVVALGDSLGSFELPSLKELGSNLDGEHVTEDDLIALGPDALRERLRRDSASASLCYLLVACRWTSFLRAARRQ